MAAAQRAQAGARGAGVEEVARLPGQPAGGVEAPARGKVRDLEGIRLRGQQGGDGGKDLGDAHRFHAI
jgi:hypothetical protein